MPSPAFRRALPAPSSVLAVSFAGAILTTPIAAQTQPDPFRLDPLVVTATRWSLPRSLAPAAVTVLHGDELRARGVRFVADALRHVAGAHVVRSGSHGALTSLFMRGGESDYVQVMIDGIVANDPGGAFDFAHLTTDNIERIEIVRGPVSVLYGSDAVAGVVHIITRSGRNGARLDASAGLGLGVRTSGEPAVCPGYPREPCPESADLGTYAARSLDAAITGGAGAFAYAFAASHLESGGAATFNNGYRNQSMNGRLQLRAREGTEVSASARWTDGTFHFPTDGAGRLVDRNQQRTTESLLLGLDAAHSPADRLDLRFALSLHRGDAVTNDPIDGPADTLGSFESRNASRSERRKADLHADLRLGAATIVTAGLETESQSGRSSFTSQSQYGPFATSSANERTNRAVYAQAVAPVGGALRLSAGARAEDNDRFGTFTTWRLGANLQPGYDLTLRAAAGTGFKEPTFYENYASGFVNGNPALMPEESRSIEIGIERQWLDGRGRIGVTWFDQRFADLIQYLAAPARAADPNYINIGEAKAAGLELEAHFGTVGRQRFEASWTLLDTEVLDAGTGEDRLFQQGETLIRRPTHRWSISAATPVGASAGVRMSVTRVGARDDLDFLDDFAGERVRMPAFTTVDLSTQLQPFERAPALTLRVDNLLDERHREIANFPATGRVIFVGLAASR